MLRLVIGYRTEHRESDPIVLYVGHDADAAQTAVDHSDPSLIRVEVAEVPHARRARKNRVADGEPLPLTAVPQITGAPTIEDALAMIERIEQLEKLLSEERAKMDEERAGLQEEFKRQIAVASREIFSLREGIAQLQNSKPNEAPPFGTGPALPPAESEAASDSGSTEVAPPAADVGGASPKKSKSR
jgi:hypothetical protein